MLRVKITERKKAEENYPLAINTEISFWTSRNFKKDIIVDHNIYREWMLSAWALDKGEILNKGIYKALLLEGYRPYNSSGKKSYVLAKLIEDNNAESVWGTPIKKGDMVVYTLGTNGFRSMEQSDFINVFVKSEYSFRLNVDRKVYRLKSGYLLDITNSSIRKE